MEYKGITRRLDWAGRVVIPASYRRQLGLDVSTTKSPGSEVEVLNTDQGILIRPVRA